MYLEDNNMESTTSYVKGRGGQTGSGGPSFPFIEGGSGCWSPFIEDAIGHLGPFIDGGGGHLWMVMAAGHHLSMVAWGAHCQWWGWGLTFCTPYNFLWLIHILQILAFSKCQLNRW